LDSSSLAFTKEQIDKLTDELTDTEIATLTGIAYSAVRRARLFYNVKTFTQKTGLVKIKETGELRKKGSVRGVIRSDGLIIDYFKEIDTPEKAYWLGLLLADGWTTCRNNIPKEVGLALKLEDKEALEQLKRDVKYSGQITDKINKNSYKKGESVLSTLRITCQKFTEYTIAAGIQERKSGKLKLPKGAYAFPSCFCRGYFDGNGSINERNFSFICVSEDFNTELNTFLEENAQSRLNPSFQVSSKTGKPVWRLTGYRQDKKLLSWLYNSEGFKLHRKHEKFLTYWD
jgi:hypothetical protein